MEDFNIISSKSAYHMNELTSNEINLILKYIRQYVFNAPDNYNFFENDDCNWIAHDVHFTYWQWKNNVLIDMNGFPGDNEDGCIFLNGDVVILNSDRNLIATEICPSELQKSMLLLDHLRPNGNLYCEDEEGDKVTHDHCIKQHLKWCSEIKRKCHCEYCVI